MSVASLLLSSSLFVFPIHFLAHVCLSEELLLICHLVSLKLLLLQCIFIVFVYVCRCESGVWACAHGCWELSSILFKNSEHSYSQLLSCLSFLTLSRTNKMSNWSSLTHFQNNELTPFIVCNLLLIEMSH